ncbi:hypothetical protein NDU88_004211 [Pleurodeles waltl]|uniref:Uncharacterized protein n=1 Tax=Pleurodeles waltl TaxID=8319 RepID=A0AAV7TQV3_PLEWA|nr:hypothetical protein NDU88_004211 [Pleurodeles waltl]
MWGNCAGVGHRRGQRPPEEGHLACHRQGGPDPGGTPETGTHCRKRWEDIRHCSKKTAEAQMGMASQRGRGARRTMTALMFRILAVAYPELDGHLRTSQQTQGGPPPIHQSRRSASAKKPPVPVVRVPGFWSAPSTRAGSRTRSQGTVSPPPVKVPKLESGQRDRVKTPGGTTTEMASKEIGESAVTPKKVGKVLRKSPQPVVSVTAEKCAIISGGPDTTASTVVTGPETTARVTAQEGSSIVTGQETTARVTAQEGSSIVTGQETTATAGVTAQEGSSIVTGQETTARFTAQEGSSIVTGQKTTATAGVTAQEGSSIVTGQETTARVKAQEHSSIVTGQETTATAGVTAQEGSSIVTGQETTATAGVTAQEGSSIVTGQETTARVTAQEGSSIVTGQETTARVTAQEGSSIVTGQETTATARVTAQEGPGSHSPAGKLLNVMPHTNVQCGVCHATH